MTNESTALGFFRRLWCNVIQDVPAAIAHCEFDCRRSNCLQSEWATCSRRLAAEKALTVCEHWQFGSESLKDEDIERQPLPHFTSEPI